MALDTKFSPLVLTSHRKAIAVSRLFWNDGALIRQVVDGRLRGHGGIWEWQSDPDARYCGVEKETAVKFK